MASYVWHWVRRLGFVSDTDESGSSGSDDTSSGDTSSDDASSDDASSDSHIQSGEEGQQSPPPEYSEVFPYGRKLVTLPPQR